MTVKVSESVMQLKCTISIFFFLNVILEGIILEAYSPLGSPGNPLFQGKEPTLKDDPVIMEICHKHNASFAQVCSKCISYCS